MVKPAAYAAPAAKHPRIDGVRTKPLRLIPDERGWMWLAVNQAIFKVSQEELAGVLAHELGHVKHRDTLTMTITAVMAGAISMLANMAFFMGGSRDRDHPLGMVGVLLVTLLAPIAAVLVQAAISRSREFEADRAGAEITGRPMWLASALGQIERAAEQTPNYPADANPATAHMFIVNPLHGGISGLFATHPPTEERIARLRAMAGNDAAPVRRGPWG